MKKNGFTVLELIVSFTLAATIGFFLLKITVIIKDLYTLAYIKTNIISKQDIITERMYDDFLYNDVKVVLKCGKNCIRFIFSDNTEKLFKIEDEETIKWGDFTTKLKDGSTFNNISVKILNDLNSCYPFPHEQIETKMVNYFGIINKKIVKQAEKCIKNGYIKELGKLMTYSQKLFDKYAIPICPSELTAPLLHNILNDPFIKKHSYGGKGVGSQGDGTAQIIAKNKNSQTAIINYLKKMGYNSYIFDLKKTNKIKKAVIPVAGYGTRLYPYTKLINKEFCPVVYENKLKPQISVLLEELYDSNIDKICLIISSNKQKKLYKDYLLKHSNYLNTFSNYEDNVNYEEKLRKIWKKIKFIKNRHVNYGFAYSISLAKKFVGSDNFILCLGDTIYSSNNSSNCCKQLIDFYDKTKTSCVGVKKISIEEVKNYGTIKISKINNNNITIEKLYEKPDYELARKKLLINDECYAFFGNYILDCKIFKILKKNLKYNKSSCIFTDCLDEIRDTNNLLGYLIDGNSYDFGNVESYINNFGNIKSIGDE